MTSSKAASDQEPAPRSHERESSVAGMEPEVIRKRAQLRAIIDTIPDLVSVKDRQGVYSLCNRAFSEHVGKEPKAVVGSTDEQLFEADVARLRTEFDQVVIDGEKTRRSESWEDSVDGQRVLFDTLETPFYNYEGELLGLLEVSRDITERHRMEEELRQARDQLHEQYEQLKEMEELRDSLTNMIVHDLRSPLTGIITSLQMLQEDSDELSEDSAQDVNRALRSATLLAQMVTGVLDVSKMEAGDMRLDIRAHDLVQTSRDAIDSLGGLTADRAVVVEAEEEVQAAYDEAIVTRVVTNLVANALRFTPDDAPVSVVVRTEGDGSARVEVRDAGSGIPAEYHESIFDKFGRVERRGESVKVSTGLGLAFCRMAVEAHGGRIGVVSKEGEGSVFWFEIPAPSDGP
jgi:PAS domain S-box-containing protein